MICTLITTCHMLNEIGQTLYKTCVLANSKNIYIVGETLLVQTGQSMNTKAKLTWVDVSIYLSSSWQWYLPSCWPMVSIFTLTYGYLSSSWPTVSIFMLTYGFLSSRKAMKLSKYLSRLLVLNFKLTYDILSCSRYIISIFKYTFLVSFFL